MHREGFSRYLFDAEDLTGPALTSICLLENAIQHAHTATGVE